ncbi:MAG TPA: PA14 domain-containing protein [Bryobacteraceae bacterium]|nr:PA14 domain-containing protein [Bryobacteraceae bacterium]
MNRPAVGLIAIFASASVNSAQDGPVPKFGTTVVVPLGLRGDIYYIRRNTTKLPNFQKLKPKGTIYTASLNVPPQDFRQGFPGVTKRFEWFAIDYSGRFWIEKPGDYRFALTSDDGAQLYIDGQLTIDNDGTHPPRLQQGEIRLSAGVHRIRVPYFQGPRFNVALVLEVAGPGDEPMRVFNTDEFKPPPNASTVLLPDN